MGTLELRTLRTAEERRKRVIECSVPVTETGCWIWEWSTDTKGYGKIVNGQKQYGAHRFSYEVFVGEIPSGMSVLHRCNTPLCVNPAHLYAGTLKQNSEDMLKAGRQIYGDRHSQSKITSIQAAAIRHKYISGRSQDSLAEEYGISQSQISRIVRREKWRHVE